MTDGWPREMRISVEERNRSLLELLFVRSAWGLVLDEPALEPVPDPGVSELPAAPDTQTWETRWREAWSRAWDALLQSSPSTSTSDRRPLTWIEQFGSDGIDQRALVDWLDGFMPDLSAALDSRPERRNIAALRGAWESGLEAIVVLPYRYPYAERISIRYLVVSSGVRQDPDRYAEALQLRAI